MYYVWCVHVTQLYPLYMPYPRTSKITYSKLVGSDSTDREKAIPCDNFPHQILALGITSLLRSTRDLDFGSTLPSLCSSRHFQHFESDRSFGRFACS